MVDKEAEIRSAMEAEIQKVGSIAQLLLQNEASSILEFASSYQAWYSAALPVIRQIVPDRTAEFVGCYEPPLNRKMVNLLTYTIRDFIAGVGGLGVEDGASVVLERLTRQLAIFRGAHSRLGSSLADIRGTLEAELFDDELSVARELLRRNHLRAAGAVAGVVLERHLGTVADTHNVRITKRFPTVADLNDPLKNAGLYDLPQWRKIQHLADIRNLCVHSKDRDPSREEVVELIDGVARVIKNVF